MNNSLKSNFLKIIEKAISKDEPLNSYLSIMERRWLKTQYNSLFPKREYWTMPPGEVYRDGKFEKFGGTVWL